MGVIGEKELDKFAEAVASPAPAPGGGSVAAVCGALSAALARMVANIALGKKEYESAHRDLRRLCKEAEGLQDTLLQLAEEDSEAYRAVIKSFSLPKDTTAQKERRRRVVQAALKRAAEVPLETMESCLDVLSLSRMALRKGSREAFTDAGSAALLAHAALKSAELNVRVNLMSIRDDAFRRRAEAEAGKMSRDATALLRTVKRLVRERMR